MSDDKKPELRLLVSETPPPTPEERRIIKAWTVVGKSPWFHGIQIARLKREWPTLADAIVALVEKHRGQR